MKGNFEGVSASRDGKIIKLHRESNEPCILMGIVNVTPDSFFSSSRQEETDNAVNIALKMLDDGATWIDSGGESTRPGADFVSVEEEIERVLPVITKLRSLAPNCLISIDTRKHEVARIALENGADMINDVSGLREQKMFDLVIEKGCAVCIMHMQGEPGTMQENPTYSDVVEEVTQSITTIADRLVQFGHPRDLIVIDPGIGFGKSKEHNLALMKATKKFKDTGYSLLWGISRKSIIGQITNQSDPSNRLSGTLGSSYIGKISGVDILRIHDVREHQDFFDVINELSN